MGARPATSMGLRIENINSLAELDRIGVQYEKIGGKNEVKLQCPVHDDASPSANLNYEKNLWRCHSCSESGDFISMLAVLLKTERSIIVIDLSTRYDITEVKSVNIQVVEKYRKDLSKAGPLMLELYKRGLTDADIKTLRIGFNPRTNRFSIPVYDKHRNIVNVRLYKPGAPGPDKMRNTRGYLAMAIFQEEQIEKFENIVLYGGELKAYLGKKHFNEHGFGAIAATAGEGNWDVAWNKQLEGKNLYLCFDIDSAGKVAAHKVARLTSQHVKQVYIVDSPIDIEKHPKGDINDYFGDGGEVEPFLKAIQGAEKFDLVDKELMITSGDMQVVTLKHITRPELIGKNLNFKGTVIAVTEQPYFAPSSIGATCTKSESMCSNCAIYKATPGAKGVMKFPINPLNKKLLGFIELPDKGVDLAVRACIGVPYNCPSFYGEQEDKFALREVRMQPILDMSANESDYTVQAAYLVDKNPEIGSPYEFSGTLWESPRNQQAVLLVSKSEETEDSLESFARISPTEMKELSIFQPEEWALDSVEKLLTDIYEDFAINVTRIHCRPDLHFMMDITYHSALMFEFSGEETPGWVNSIVIGDSAQGKSKVLKDLQKHFGLGSKVEMKNASRAGLLGGLQKFNGQWFVSWGAIPKNDRGLVALEEVKGASVQVIGKLTDMRSSGIAEIDQIEQRKVQARTRLIWLSNARSDSPMNSYTFGVSALAELIGSAEDVRRFDICTVVDKRDLKIEDIKKFQHVKVDHKYTSELCKKLILLAWTLKKDQIEFDEGVEQYILDESETLGKRYECSVPLIDTGSIRLKVARLAVALACRTFSYENDALLVRKCHVEWIVRKLDTIYDAQHFGYRDLAIREQSLSELKDPEIIKKYLTIHDSSIDLVDSLLYADVIEERDIQDWGGLDRDDARQVLSVLVRKNGISRVQGKPFYKKNPELILLLKKIQRELANPKKKKKVVEQGFS